MCKYCDASDKRQLVKATIIMKYENPKAFGFPERCFWEERHVVNVCPFCGAMFKLTDQNTAESIEQLTDEVKEFILSQPLDKPEPFDSCHNCIHWSEAATTLSAIERLGEEFNESGATDDDLHLMEAQMGPIPVLPPACRSCAARRARIYLLRLLSALRGR